MQTTATTTITITTAFLKSNRVETVRELEARAAHLGDALEWVDDGSEAAPIEEELRIISKVLAAIKAEHAPGYFGSAT